MVSEGSIKKYRLMLVLRGSFQSRQGWDGESPHKVTVQFCPFASQLLTAISVWVQAWAGPAVTMKSSIDREAVIMPHARYHCHDRFIGHSFFTVRCMEGHQHV